MIRTPASSKSTMQAILAAAVASALAILLFREPEYGAIRTLCAVLGAGAGFATTRCTQALASEARARVWAAGARVARHFDTMALVASVALGPLAAITLAFLAEQPRVCAADCDGWSMHGYAAHLGVLAGVCLGFRRFRASSSASSPSETR